MENLSGQSIKGYELHERIGAGGFGAVYKAYQSTVGREVAVKIILPHFANQPDFIRRFETEAQLVARLEHLHIIPLYDYWRDPDGAYLVMRWLKGGSLRDALKNGAFSPESAALLLDQISAALAAAHRSHVIHRDLKPGNILLDEDGNAYLADFGIAKDIDHQHGVSEPDAIVGSPDYLAPEQARSEPVTPRTDIYSLGVVLYEMLTGEHPFPNLNMVERLFKHLSEPLPEITTLDDSIRVGVNEVIQKATAKNPLHRYADVLEMASAFRQAAQTKSGSVIETLTQREQQILGQIIEGRSNKEIAQELFVTVMTVKWHITQIYHKLGVRSRVQAIIRARELHLINTSGEYGSDPSISNVSIIPTDQFQPENPYKGLRAFQSADNQDFFGREKLVEKLVKRMSEGGTGLKALSVNSDDANLARFLAIVGPSGSGKSSLVKAGLIPAIWHGDLPGSEKWFVIEMMPSAHPLDELEIALTRIAANQSGNLREQLERDKRGLIRAAHLTLPNDGSELLVVIDQFEEVFTLVESESERIHFLDLLCTAVTEVRSRVRVVITLRADFYDRPLHYPEFGELVRSRMETVLPLSAEGLERAIARPAERVGVNFEPGLVAAIIGEINYQTGALPLLQYALTELFENRRGHTLTQEAYQSIGRTTGALAKRADEIYRSMDDAGKEAIRQMFLRLVTLGEGVEDTRRRVPRSELLALTDNFSLNGGQRSGVNFDSDVIDEVIDTYANYRLLSLDNDPATRAPTVEVAHEAILREWERLRNWLNESRDDVRLQRQLMALASEWYNAKQDASFLLRGSRLEVFEKWIRETQLALIEKERQFISTSLAQRAKEVVTEENRQARELQLAQEAAASAQKAAASQKSAADRLRLLVAVMALAIIGTLVLSGVAINQGQVAQQNALLADRNAAEAQNVALIASSQAALATGDTGQAIALAMQAVNLDPQSALARIALSDAAYTPGAVRIFEGHTDRIHNVRFTNDGQRALSSSDDQTVILWDVATGSIIHRYEEYNAWVTALAFSPDNQTFISGTSDATLLLRSVETGEIIRRYEGHGDRIEGVAFSPDGQTFVSASDDRSLILWNVETGEIVRRFIGHTDKVISLALSPDGRMLLSGSDIEDKRVILWDMQTGEILHQFLPVDEANQVNAVGFSPDGQYFFSASGGGTAYLVLWDVASGEMVRQFYGNISTVTAAAFSADGQTIVSGAVDGAIILYDLETGQTLRHLQGHTSPITEVNFSPDGRYLLSSSWDGTVRLWDLLSGQIVHRFSDFGGSLDLSNDGQTLLLCNGADASVWNVQTRQETQSFTADGGVNCNVGSIYGDMALLGTGDPLEHVSSDVVLWNMETGEEIRRFHGHSAGIPATVFSPDGRFAASAGGNGDQSVILWDVETGELIRQLTGQEQNIWALAYSPDGQTILSGDETGGLILWNVNTGEMIRRFEGHTNFINNIVFAQDGQTALSSSWDGQIILWDVMSGTIIRKLSLQSAAALSVALSPDERTAFVGLSDDTSLLWDTATGIVFRRFTGGAWGSIFSSDGHSVYVSLGDRAEQWHLDSLEDLIAWTQANRYIPELTCEQRALYRLEPLCGESTATP